MIPKEQRDKWRAEAEGAMMISALWEYCPPEFLELLDAYEELAGKVAGWKARVMALREHNFSPHTTLWDLRNELRQV